VIEYKAGAVNRGKNSTNYGDKKYGPAWHTEREIGDLLFIYRKATYCVIFSKSDVDVLDLIIYYSADDGTRWPSNNA